MVNTTLIVFMIITIILLFSSMVLASMASVDAQKGGESCDKGAHKYSMWAAIVTGIATAIITVVLVVYVYTTRSHIAAAAQKHVGKLQGALGGIAGTPPYSVNTGSMY